MTKDLLGFLLVGLTGAAALVGAPPVHGQTAPILPTLPASAGPPSVPATPAPTVPVGPPPLPGLPPAPLTPPEGALPSVPGPIKSPLPPVPAATALPGPVPPGTPLPGPVLPGIPEGAPHPEEEGEILSPTTVEEPWQECCRPARFWFTGEYLLWFIHHTALPPIYTSGSPTDILPGALGMAGTSVLFGGAPVTYDARSGGRFTGGMWFDDDHLYGIEASYLFLGSRAVGYANASSGAAGTPVLARPYVDAITGIESSSLVAYPGLSAGAIQAAITSRLQGAELNGLFNLHCGACVRADLLTGIRYLRFQENLGIAEGEQVSASSPAFAGDTIGVNDYFGATNNFYGGNVGVRACMGWGRFDTVAVVKVALGATNELVNINGTTSITGPGHPATLTPAGLLALPTNGGSYSRNAFAVLPEGDLSVGYWITNHLRAFIGYSFLYLSNVVRPGDQIDRTINTTYVPTTLAAGPTSPARPSFSLSSTDFWAQGINFGLTYRY
jgi:hypothetical protein